VITDGMVDGVVDFGAGRILALDVHRYATVKKDQEADKDDYGNTLHHCIDPDRNRVVLYEKKDVKVQQ
jgi:hypothetical protein